MNLAKQSSFDLIDLGALTMRLPVGLAIVLMITLSSSIEAKKTEHQWLVGKILDENRARYFAGMLNNSSSQTTENGTWNGSANSTSVGDSTNTQANGNYSGIRNTSTSGSSVAVYRVYDNLVIEGDDTVYVTSERIRWRWSKGAHVAVNGTIRYYVDGRKLHVLDDDSKEHTIDIVKEIRKIPLSPRANTSAPQEDRTAAKIQPSGAPSAQALVAIDSVPEGADIEVDGNFVGDTPSSVNVAPGSHEITVKKTGFTDWTRKLNITGGNVHLSADLDAAPAQ
ncbi:MAG TPA: PEGA domain-containing protein [Terracidiphilus sp.]|jgi:hypothetical protein|nr:PEGA domain-containing protein [Terracidiphilus sp.]